MFEIKNIADSPTAEIKIFGDIGDSWFSEGNTIESVTDQLNGLQGKQITCTVSSLGGDLFQALAIYDVLRAHGNVNTKIIGATASAGTVIAMAGKERTMSNAAAFLIHQAQGFAAGNADEMLKQSRELAKFDGILANLYSDVTGRPSPEMYSLMKEEKWLTAESAKQYNLVTDIFSNGTVLNTTELNKYFPNVKPINEIQNLMTPEEIQALQDENTALKTQVAELAAKLAEMEAEKEGAEAEKIAVEDTATIEAACGAGKIDETMKNHFQNLIKTDRAGTIALINALPVQNRRAIDDIKNNAGQGAQKTPKQIFNERLKSNFYKNNKEAYKADFKTAFGTEPVI